MPSKSTFWIFTPLSEPAVASPLPVPLAVQYAIDTMSMRFHVFRVDAPVLDLSERGDIPGVVRRLEGVTVML